MGKEQVMAESRAGAPAPTEVEAKHPLMEFRPRSFDTFEAWLARWRETEYLAEKLGLLHVMMDDRSWWVMKEALLFLLSIADGYADDSNFVTSRFESSSPSAKDRKKIAEKAFGVLCERFFKGDTRDNKHSWLWALTDEDLFNKILWFLRSGDFSWTGNYRPIKFDIHNHQQDIFRAFLKEFARLGWRTNNSHERQWGDDATRETVKSRLKAARPRLVEVLGALGELSWLNRQELDDASLKKLTEMAMADNHFFPSDNASSCLEALRKPISLEEAVLGGSVAAQVVLLHGIREKERARINALFEESRRRLREQKRQRELASLTKKQGELAQRAEELAEGPEGGPEDQRTNSP